MRDQYFIILCYVDDDVFSRNFRMICSIIITANKIKCMATSNDPLQYKLEVNQKSVVVSFKYLRVELSSLGDVLVEVSQQVPKVNKLSSCRNCIIWKNKY